MTHTDDTLPTCDTCGQCGTVPHSDGIEAEFNNYFPTCDTCGQWEELCMCMETTICPVCGSPIDYCLGHGDIGDPRGADIANSHDDDDHSRCHWRSDCSPRNYWGSLKSDVSDDFCPVCERDLPYHYSICPNNNNN